MTNLSTVREVGVISVIRAPSVDSAVAAVEAIVAGGVTGIEITYSTPDVARVLTTLADRFGDRILLGAGTVTNPDQAREAVDAGAAFLVSPGTRPALLEAMAATGAMTMSGALTPSEVMTAVEGGADVVKLFPASLGGPKYLASLRGPFPNVPLMPTGGVNVSNIEDWVRAGALAVGVGGELVSGADFAAGQFDVVTERARELAAAYRQALKAVQS